MLFSVAHHITFYIFEFLRPLFTFVELLFNEQSSAIIIMQLRIFQLYTISTAVTYSTSAIHGQPHLITPLCPSLSILAAFCISFVEAHNTIKLGNTNYHMHHSNITWKYHKSHFYQVNDNTDKSSCMCIWQPFSVLL
jgi:hypothetical protein